MGRWRWMGAVVLAVVGTVGSPVAAAPESAATVDTADETELRPCRGMPQVLCGTLTRLLDPADPHAGTIDIGFELHPARSGGSEGTIVTVEGGPGYSSTASRDWFLELYEPLRDTRDILIVDNRGTGTSEPIWCRRLQSYRGDYLEAVRSCGIQLGTSSDLYGTALAADDMAAVLDHLGIDRIDLYGVSYGTFFAQTFAVRHPHRLRTLTLDAAYPVEGLDPWYRDINRAIVDAFQAVCARDPGCAAAGGDPIERLRAVADALAVAPLTGTAPDADGVKRTVTVDVPLFSYLMGVATYGPMVYRELDAAGQAWLENGDQAPLLRIAAEQTWWFNAGPVEEYSEGLYVAVICNDYPQLWDISAPEEVRIEQYQASVAELHTTDPDAFYPFTIDEWLVSDWTEYTSCLPWPAPDPWVPPLPEPHEYPDVPTLVLVGDLDSITSPEESLQVADQFPDATYVEVPNVAHATALGDYSRCAADIAVELVATGAVGDTSCVDTTYPPVRAVEVFPVDLADVIPAAGASEHAGRVARAVTDTVGDVFPRWLSAIGWDGVGLRGGRFTSTGLDQVRFQLTELRYVTDLRVSG
ncbi:MAG: alpha/beta hydrolase, partial [Actinomycetota bacterium]|nr:alpha/beta hydrolase [Actinomycetota bacterium]